MAVLKLDKFKGLHTSHVPQQIEDEEQQELTNWDLTEQGGLIKRTGAREPTSAGFAMSSAKMLGRFKTDLHDKILIYDTVAGRLWYTTPGTAPTYNFNGVQLTTAVAFLQWAQQYGDLVYIVGISSTNQFSWDVNSLTLTNMAGKPPATQNLFWKDREWLINSYSIDPVFAAYSSLRYSNLAGSGGTDFSSANHPASNSINIGEDNGDWLTAIIPYNDALYIFKTRGIWVLYADGSPEDWTLRQISNNLGCISRATPIVYENLLYFEARDGFYRTDGTTFEEISAPIRNLFNTRPIALLDTFNDCTAIIEDKLILSVKWNSNGQRYTFVYNLNVEGWSLYDWGTSNIQPNAFALLPDFAPEVLVFTSHADTKLRTFGKKDQYKDGIFDYTAVMRSKYFDFGEPGTWKRMIQANIDYNSTNPDSFPKYRWRFETGTPDAWQTLRQSTGAPQLVSTSVPIKPAGWLRRTGFEFSVDYGSDVYLNSISMRMSSMEMVGKSVGTPS